AARPDVCAAHRIRPARPREGSRVLGGGWRAQTVAGDLPRRPRWSRHRAPGRIVRRRPRAGGRARPAVAGYAWRAHARVPPGGSRRSTAPRHHPGSPGTLGPARLSGYTCPKGELPPFVPNPNVYVNVTET